MAVQTLGTAVQPLGFEGLGLVRPLLQALDSAGYEHPTPIQLQTIPPALEGRDVLGCAQTGTGKTAAFALPILQRLDATAGRHPVIRALILTPTRELAAQIGDSFGAYGKNLELYHSVIFGGVKPGPQIEDLRRGVDVLVATPGRLLDLMSQRKVDLSRLEVFVLDEADRMLDMGFIHDVRRVVQALPKQRQTLFFSATLPPDIVELSGMLLIDPVHVSVTPEALTVDLIEQRVFFVDKQDKRGLLVDLLRGRSIEHTLVFSRTKHGADRVMSYLERAGIACAAIHGNKSQNARERALDAFRAKKIRALVATDIAARGIDIDGISHVINFDLPNIPETYVHRIGRTGRAGAAGIALSFCDDEERAYLADIERLIGKHLARVEDHAYPPRQAPPPETLLGGRRDGRKTSAGAPQRAPSRGGHGGGQGGRRPWRASRRFGCSPTR
jgi:ATP-dependent RNA helicase RhlE